MEEALYEVAPLHRFAGLSLTRGNIPDETTILNFRRLVETYGLAPKVDEAPHFIALHALARKVLAARKAGVLMPQQAHIADQCEVLVRGLARVGIIALVDEATGYQNDRARDSLAKILEAFVAKELQPWVKTFPSEFYEQMFRLRGLPFPNQTVKRPQYFGHLTNDVIYRRLAPGVWADIKKQADNDSAEGKATGRLHQRLTQDIGHPKLRDLLTSVTTVMKLSDQWDDFKEKLEKVHPAYNDTMQLPLEISKDDGKGI